MRAAYVCWDEVWEGDPGPDAKGANVVADEYDTEGAAETYAERIFYDRDCPRSLTIHVRDAAGVVVVVEVDFEAAPSFSGRVRT